jgi:hypothetical protein
MMDRDVFIQCVSVLLRKLLRKGYTGNIKINIRDGVGDAKISENKNINLEELRKSGT